MFIGSLGMIVLAGRNIKTKTFCVVFVEKSFSLTLDVLMAFQGVIGCAFLRSIDTLRILLGYVPDLFQMPSPLFISIN